MSDRAAHDREGIDWLRARAELSEPTSEINALLDFAACLREDYGWQWDRQPQRGDDPPDYFLWTGGGKIGVEVTTLRACQNLVKANARVRRAVRFLRQEAAKITLAKPAHLELLFVPLDPDIVPDPRKQKKEFGWLLHYVKGFAGTGLRRGGLCFGRAAFWVCRSDAGASGIHVRHQGFFRADHEDDWQRDINQAVRDKIRRYGVRPYTPCWLLLNLKPYLWSANETEEFLSRGVPIDNVKEVKKVFERVYAVTEYVPKAGGDSPPRVLQLA